jgi:hypothetical protein
MIEAAAYIGGGPKSPVLPQRLQLSSLSINSSRHEKSPVEPGGLWVRRTARLSNQLLFDDEVMTTHYQHPPLSGTPHKAAARVW